MVYNNAINSRLNQVPYLVNDIINDFKANDLSLWGIVNFDSVKNYSSITSSNRFPTRIKVGYAKHLKSSNLTTKIPLIIDILKSKGINIIETKANSNLVHNIIQNLTLRIVLSLPESMCNVHIIDPSSNGANYNFLLGSEKIKKNLLTDELSINTKMNEIISGFTNIQTNILSYKFNNIEEYNLSLALDSSDAPVPYNIILITNFPEGIGHRRENVIAIKKIIDNGIKYGTIVLMSSSEQALNSQQYQYAKEVEGLQCTLMQAKDNSFNIENCEESKYLSAYYSFVADTDLPIQKNEFIDLLNKRSAEDGKLANSFDAYYNELKTKNQIWSFSSKDFIDFTIGYVGAKKISGFHLGQKDGKSNIHALVGGRTGAGKSNFLHNVIINSAYKYSPEELQFYLIDMKGTSFTDYYKLPHVKILFQDGEKVEIALNVLTEVQKEFHRRARDFKAQKIDEFSNFRNNNKLPRILLIIDEFQTFNQSDNYEAKNKSKEIIEQLVTKGRSYGIHLLLASQHLANANLSETAKANIQVRLVLPLDPDACHYILSRDNTDAQYLNIGQMIYNDKLGYDKSNNINFRLPLLDQNVRNIHVEFLYNKFQTSGIKDFTRFFLPGEENILLESNKNILGNFDSSSSNRNKIYIGRPYFIREEDSYISFEKNIENNLLILGQDARTSYRLLFLIIIQFLKQNSNNIVYYLQYTPKSNRYYNIFSELSHYSQKFIQKDIKDVNDTFDEIENIISEKKNQEYLDSNVLLVIPQINTDTTLNVRNNPTVNRLKAILENGPVRGIHSVVYVESYNSFYEISTLCNLCTFKIATKDGDSSRIADKKEIDNKGFVYLSGPSECTTINPDLMVVYNSYRRLISVKLDTIVFDVINKLFEEI